MGRRCQICSNTSINIINRALLGGSTLSEIARRYGLALGSLHRHRSKCLGLPTSQAVTAAPSRLAGIEAALPTREEVAGGFASIRSQLDGIVADAKAKGQLSNSVAALDGLCVGFGHFLTPAAARLRSSAAMARSVAAP